MHVSYTFAKAELVKAALQLSSLTMDFAPNRVANLYFVQAFYHAVSVKHFIQ